MISVPQIKWRTERQVERESNNIDEGVVATDILAFFCSTCSSLTVTLNDNQ